MTSVILFIATFSAVLWVVSVLLVPKPFGEPVAPDPAHFEDPVVQVYGADVWGARGRFAIHTWVALKGHGADTYEIYQVIGWRKRRGRPVLSISEGQPDRPWYGSPPILLHEKRGDEAASLLDPIRAAVASYPYPDDYKMFPGPNSNSFVAWIGLEVPELGLDLPAKALGQTWMNWTYNDHGASGN